MPAFDRRRAWSASLFVGGRPPLELPSVREAQRRQFALIDRPDAPQLTLFLGLPVVGPAHRDWIALQVTDYLLGGAFGSRITTNIREQKGYTYSPDSQVEPYLKGAHWAEIDRIRKEMAVTPTDVQRIATTYLQPDRMALVVVGDTKAVKDQLAPWTPSR